MLRFLLPAFALTGALLVLFAGAISDHLGSFGVPDPTPRFASKAPEQPLAPAPDRQQREAPAVSDRTPQIGQDRPPQIGQQPATPEPPQREVLALQQQAKELQQQLTQRSQELEQRTQELQQRSRDAQAAQTEADRLRQAMDAARQQRQENDGAKQAQLAARSAELERRSQELSERKRDLDQRSHDADAAQAEADRLRQVIDALRQQNKSDPGPSVRQKTEEASVARQKPKQQSPATPQEPLRAQRRPLDAGIPARQLVTAKQWLAAGRPDEARRLLATAQTEMVLQPVTPDSPYAQGASAPAADVGNAIRWLDSGANRQAMEAIDRAIEATGGPGVRVRAWSGYQTDGSSGYSQPFGPRYYSSDAAR
jgi:hypothetical protein